MRVFSQSSCSPVVFSFVFIVHTSTPKTDLTDLTIIFVISSLFSFADFKKCSRSFSILFVAFDFEEWEDCNNTALYPKCACSKIDCGSRAFVANLTGFYNGSLNSNGNLQGAIIMDTVMNYNDTPNSQVLPLLTDKLLPEVFNQVKADEFRGNFLSVVGRQVDDRALMDAFWYHYSNVKSGKN